MSDPSTSNATPVNERVAVLVNDIIRASAHAPHLGDRLRDEGARWRSKETTVVVAAEPNRGKTSLVNALLGEEVLPSGSTAATAAHVVLRHGPERRASVVRDGDVQVQVPMEDVARLALASPGSGVAGVVIELDHPLLATGLVLVDTPGVGSLQQAHGRITLASLSKADALVFLLDPAEPLSHPELLFLSQAATRLERVLFAMARTDRNPGWRTVARDDAELIERHAPRFAGAPILPTSSKLARTAADLDAAGTPDPALQSESGLPALVDALLRTVVGRVAAVRLANMLRLSSSVLDELDAPLHAASTAAEGESQARAVAAAEQTKLDELRDAADRLGVEVTDRFNALRELANTEFTRLLKELSSRFDATKGEMPATGDELVDLVHAEVRAGCAELTERLDAEVTSIAAEITAVVGDLDVDLQSMQLGTDAVSGTVDTSVGPADPMVRLRIASAVASGGTGITMFGKYMAGDPILAGMMGAGAVLGITMAAINVKMSRRQRDVAGARQQVQGALEAARTEVTPALRQQVLSVQRELERAMKAALRQQSRDLQARVNDATQLARADAQQRQAAKVDADRRLAAHGPLRSRLAALRHEVDAILYSA